MATDFINFQPDAASVPPFQFQTTLAEGLRSFYFYWNMTGERWYMEVKDSSGNTLLYRPLISSPATTDLNLISSISTSSLIYRETNGVFEVTND